MDIACDPELVKLAIGLTSCPVNSYFSYRCLSHSDYIWFVDMGKGYLEITLA